MFTTDPLARLGPDLFHRISRYLDVADLMRTEQVSVAWKTFSRYNCSLWRFMALREGVDATEVAEMDKLHATGFEMPELHPGGNTWRQLCRDTIPAMKAWKHGQAKYRYLEYPEGTPASVTVAHVFARGFVSSSEGALTLSDLNYIVDSVRGVPAYQYLETAECGSTQFVIGMHINNWEGVVPKPNPSTIHIWRIYSRGTGPQPFRHTPYLYFIRSLDYPLLWGYSIRTHSGKNGVDISILASATRISRLGGWCGGPQRSIHTFKIDSEGTTIGYEHVALPRLGAVKSFHIDDEFIFLPSSTEVHIYSRRFQHLVTLATPPLAAAVAVQLLPDNLFHRLPVTRTQDPDCPLPSIKVAKRANTPEDDQYGDVQFEYDEAVELAHYKALRFHNRARSVNEMAKCRTTSSDLLCAAPSGALVILRHYKEVLRLLPSMTPAHRHAFVTNYTVLVAIGSPIDDIATFNDRIAIRVSLNRETMITIDAGSLPAVHPPPAPKPKKHQPVVIDRDTPAPVETEPVVLPKLQSAFLAHVICGRKDRNRPLRGAMAMDAFGVYYPVSNGVKAHFFGPTCDD